MAVESDIIAIGADPHSNPFALEAVIEDVEEHGITKLWVLGDNVGYNAYPNECIRIIKERGIYSLFGNHDVAVLKERGVDTSNILLYMAMQTVSDFKLPAEIAKIYTAGELSDESIDFLANLSFSQRFNHSVGVHSRPYSFGDFGFYFANEENNEIFQREVNRTFETIAGREKCDDHGINICFVGHSHRPGYIVQEHDKQSHVFIPAVWGDTVHVNDRTKKYIIDVGSIGQPRDGNKDATWVEYNITKGEIIFRKTPYDVKAMVNANKKAGLPPYLSERLTVGK